MITDEQRAEIRAYVKTLNLGPPSAEFQQIVVSISRKYILAMQEQEKAS
ncbi:hypothetical protein [Mycobacteroides immunogenum]|jgi:hypothetical protein|nr:hypothetical protein [Mycobacteroides immunogenum]